MIISNTALLSLENYQHGKGVPLKEQIVLIGRDQLFDHAETVLNECGLLRRKYRLSAHWQKQIANLRKGRTRQLFYGSPKRSIDQLNELPRLFDYCGLFAKDQFRIVIGKGDYDCDKGLLNGAPDNVISILANNIDCEDSRFHYLPMGRDWRANGQHSYFESSAKKNILCYCNFSTSTHPVRESLLASLRSKDWIEFEHMGDFLDYPMSRLAFYKKLQQSKFCICPRGNGIDSFRLWDALYLGTIPIVVKEAVFHDELEDLPVLLLDSYEEFAALEPDFLEEKYQEMLQREVNYAKLTLNYWLGRAGIPVCPDSN